MKIGIVALLLALVVCSGASAADPPVTAKRKLADGGTLLTSATDIDVYTDKVVLKGNAHIKMIGAGSDTLEADADRITVTFVRKAGTNQPDQDTVKAAELVGSPRMTYVTKDPSTGVPVKTTATSTSATYNGKERTAYLKGNVKIVNENPALFDGPALMTGDEATVNLKPKLGPDEPLFSIKSSPGVSRIEVTPKPKEEEKAKK